MRELDEKTVIELAHRQNSSMAATWTEYLVLTKGQSKKYLLAPAGYDALAEATDYFDEETDDYKLPSEVHGQKVIGIEDGWVIGGDLGINMDWSGLEFDNPDEPEVAAWLDDFEWSNQIKVTDIKKALRWRGVKAS
jgi:hypothetical protein